MKGNVRCALIPLLRLCSLTTTISIHSPLDTQFPKLPPHSSTFLLRSPASLSLSHSVCLLWDVKGALSLLFICMCCRGLGAEESQTGTVKSLLCVCVYLNRVSILLDLSLQQKNTYTSPLVLISRRATLHVNITRSISILLICCHVHYHPSLVEHFKGGNLLMCYNLLCLLQGFQRLLFLSVHYFILSLSDLPSEGSRGGRHPADSSGQEPGPEGCSREGLYWRCAMHSHA